MLYVLLKILAMINYVEKGKEIVKLDISLQDLFVLTNALGQQLSSFRLDSSPYDVDDHYYRLSELHHRLKIYLKEQYEKD